MLVVASGVVECTGAKFCVGSSLLAVGEILSVVISRVPVVGFCLVSGKESGICVGLVGWFRRNGADRELAMLVHDSDVGSMAEGAG